MEIILVEGQVMTRHPSHPAQADVKPMGHVIHQKIVGIAAGQVRQGTDDGTTNRRLKVLEKNVTLDTAMRLQKLLQSRGYRVVMTRTEDRYVGLEQRADIANRAHADLFISIHFNSLENAAGVTGTETYVLTPQFQASTQPEKDRTMIPALYPGNRADHWNIVFGYQVHRQLLADLQTPDRGLKRARWVVLRLIDCPGVLVESAYLSNEAEARRVAAPEYRQRIAEAIARGVEDYAAVLASLYPGGAGAPETRLPSPSPR